MKKIVRQQNYLKELIDSQENKFLSRQALVCLIRAVLEPLLDKPEAGVVLHRIINRDGLLGLVKRLEYSDVEEYDFTEMYTEGNSIFLSTSQTLNTISAHNLVYCVAIATISMAMTVVSLFFAGFLCKAFKNCNSPFEENVIKKMQQFAYSLIPWVILTSISNSMINSLVSGKFNVNVSIDLTMLLVVLIILALAYIFKYGAVLQQESDETL